MCASRSLHRTWFYSVSKGYSSPLRRVLTRGFEGRQRVASYSELAVIDDAEEGGLLEDGRVEFKADGAILGWYSDGCSSGCRVQGRGQCGRTDGDGWPDVWGTRERVVDGDDDVHCSVGKKVAPGIVVEINDGGGCTRIELGVEEDTTATTVNIDRRCWNTQSTSTRTRFHVRRGTPYCP
ncbi:hypothetical protein CPC08DRAFT_120238 [Agrocybe pediades]|nr:hypothetical protein CPC08DRAFT_120238 [Agrocybe pediades]